MTVSRGDFSLRGFPASLLVDLWAFTRDLKKGVILE